MPEKIVSIMFADLSGYSKVRDDRLKTSIQELYDTWFNELLDDNNHFYRNTWGDGVIICCYDHVALARIGLEFRDKVRTTDWKNIGFSEDLSVRIALHLQKVTLRMKGEKVVGVTGKGVDLTARIEPIVAPNEVFCSEKFYSHLKDEENINIRAIPVGKKQLAKDYDEMSLYRLLWKYERVETHTNKEPLIDEYKSPRIRVQFTELEQNDYLTNAFGEIKNYFRNGLNELETKEQEVSTRFNETSTSQFMCEIYFRGELRSQCKIWIMNEHGGKSIAFYDDKFHMGSDNAYNECVSVENDGFEMYLKVLGISFVGQSINFQTTRFTPADVAKYLWERMLKRLEW